MTDQAETPRAIIYVDGEPLMRVWDASADISELHHETARRFMGEVATMVFKPKYGIWFRDHLTITA